VPPRFAITAFAPSSATGGGRVTLRLTARGNVRVIARRFGRTIVVGRATALRRGPGVLRLTLRPTTAGRRLLRRTGRLRAGLTATLTPSAGGARSTARRTVTLRLAR
jgi:hypothetical protein